jgi:SAM-dependent methyltransferase
MSPIYKFFRFFKVYTIGRKSMGSLIDLPNVKSVDACLAGLIDINADSRGTTALDLGCGSTPRNPFHAEHAYGIDIRESTSKNIKAADLSLEPIPFEDNAFDYITAFDILEHIPRIIYAPNRRFPFVELMNEVWRTLKPNGYFLSHTPIYPYSEIYRDPTHVNVITHETFTAYFDDAHRGAEMYGFNGSFKVISQHIKVPHLVSVLQKMPRSL